MVGLGRSGHGMSGMHSMEQVKRLREEAREESTLTFSHFDESLYNSAPLRIFRVSLTCGNSSSLFGIPMVVEGNKFLGTWIYCMAK